ncbi:hypothetical protein Pst134EB_012607 [Puccinia striiformis f. sp. tritici]|nr:hypothetical protein Pst134EB_012607 [Puccinia striiformis f. sp. tritici]
MLWVNNERNEHPKFITNRSTVHNHSLSFEQPKIRPSTRLNRRFARLPLISHQTPFHSAHSRTSSWINLESHAIL